MRNLNETKNWQRPLSATTKEGKPACAWITVMLTHMTHRKDEFLSLLTSDPSLCWHWPHADNGYGYGRIRWGEGSRVWLASRLAYTLIVGPIPPGMTLDHLCHTDSTCPGGKECGHRTCVNPAHLEPVTQASNQGRAKRHGPERDVKTHCVNGHEFTDENSGRTNKGQRFCKTCARATKERYRQKFDTSTERQ